MRLSLAEAAVRGMSPTTLSDEAQSLLDDGDLTGLMALRRKQFGGFKMEEDDADNDDTDDEDDGDDDEDEEDDEEDDDDADKGKKKKPSAAQRRIQELSAESKKYRLKAVERGKKMRELEAEVERLKAAGAKGKKADEDEDKDGDKPDDAEADRLKKENETLQERIVTQSLRMEFTDLTTGPKPLAQFKNPKKAFRLLDLDDVEIEDDGEIIGLDDAIKALAKSDPYLLVSDDEDDEDDEDEITKRRRRKTGQPTGTRKKGNPNRDKLVSKYPALRR